MLEVYAETCWIFASVTFTITVSLFVCIGDKKNGKVGSRHGLLRQNADGRRSKCFRSVLFILSTGKSRDLTKKHSIMRSRLGGAEREFVSFKPTISLVLALKVEKSERLSVHGEEVWSDRDVSKTAMGVPSDITQQVIFLFILRTFCFLYALADRNSQNCPSSWFEANYLHRAQ